MYTSFFATLTINSIAHFLYKMILLTHQMFLYQAISSDLYGIQSTIFAIIYMTIALTNFGFDETLSPFFYQYTHNKKNFTNIVQQFLIQIFIVGLTLAFTMLYNINNLHEYLHTITTNCNRYLFMIVFIVCIVESIKKTLTTFLQLCFFTQHIAISQVTGIFSYVTIVWSWYTKTKNISLESLFFPMIIIGLLEIVYLSTLGYQFYQKIPNSSDTNIPKPSSYLQERVLNYFFQIHKVIFSPNTLTVVFAYLLGFSQAATVKFYTNLITLAYTCIAKVVGVTTGAIFTHVKATASNCQLMLIFRSITKRYIHFLYILAGTTAIIITLGYYNNSITTNMVRYIIIFFIFGFLENYAITYEQLFLSLQKSYILTNVHGCNMLITLVTLYYIQITNYDPLHLCTIIILGKIISLRYLHKSMLTISTYT